jgi:hypothetical protein
VIVCVCVFNRTNFVLVCRCTTNDLKNLAIFTKH